MRSKMGWPAAHRNVGTIGRQGGLSIPGSQRMPKPYSPRSIPGRPPSGPGNDNFPWRPPPPNGHQFGKKGRGVDKELRKFVRKSPAVRRMIKWNPVFRWVWQWYNYLNPEPVANQRPDNTGWVLKEYCGPGMTKNLGSYEPNCPGEQWVSVSSKPPAYVRNWWWIDYNRQHSVFPDIYRGKFQSYWRRVTGTVHRDKKFPQEWFAPQKHPVPQDYFLPRVDPFFIVTGKQIGRAHV